MDTMVAVNDRKMHSMACALGRAEHAEPRAIGFCNHQTQINNLTKIPSNLHFKAFLMSKFNSETSFLYQLFEGNSNIILLKPCTVIFTPIFFSFFLSFFFSFFLYLSLHTFKQGYLFVYFYYNLCIYLYIYIPSNQHFKPFPVSKINSETTFLCQLFKENSNFIVLNPYKPYILHKVTFD